MVYTVCIVLYTPMSCTKRGFPVQYPQTRPDRVMGSLSGEPSAEALGLGKVAGACGGLGGLRRNCYCVDFFEDASLVGHYESARSPYCSLLIAVVYKIRAVCMNALESRSADLCRIALPEQEGRIGTGSTGFRRLVLIAPTGAVSTVRCDHT